MAAGIAGSRIRCAPHERALNVDHWQSVDLLGQHQVGGVANLGVGHDRDGRAGHVLPHLVHHGSGAVGAAHAQDVLPASAGAWRGTTFGF